MYNPLLWIVFLNVFLLIGCESGFSADSPNAYGYAITEEKNGIAITLDRVEEQQRDGYSQQQTTFYYLITNQTDEEIIIDMEREIKDIPKEKAKNRNYLQDGEGTFYRINGLGQQYHHSASEREKEMTANGKINFPANTEQLEARISYDVLGIDQFTNQVVITKPNGEIVPFTFSEEMDEEHLIRE